MKLLYVRSAIALTTVLTTAAFPLLAAAQTSYEYRALKQGLAVNSAATAPGSGPVTPPPPSPQPALQLSTSAINFGDVATNTTETRQVLVSSSGTGSLSFTAAPAVTGDAAFAAGLTTCGATLAAGADCLTDATFSPTAVGTYNGVLKFTSMLASSPHEVTLVGTAFNPVSLASTTLPKGMIGVPYSYDFKQLLHVSNEASPDKAQATWSGRGELPTGLSFNTSTGVLSGTPSVLSPGTEYTVTGTYKNNQGQQVYTIKVGNAVLEVTQITASGDHTCAVTSAGGAKCWGSNVYGQLGDGTTSNRSTPVEVTGMGSGVVSISAGGSHTCAVTSAGGVACWGRNLEGQLGNGTTVDDSTPIIVASLSSAVASLVAGSTHTCVVTTAGGAKCWGGNSLGQLGDGSTTRQLTPVNVSGLTSGVASISAGSNHSCVVTTAGGAKCWGYNSSGELGIGSTTDYPYPVNVSGLTSGVASISAGGSASCVVTTAGGAKCWGNNSNGPLGDGTTSRKLTPVNVSGLTSGVASISTARNGNHTCAVTSAGGAKCWGYNGYGQLGDGTNAQRTMPVNVLP